VFGTWPAATPAVGAIIDERVTPQRREEPEEVTPADADPVAPLTDRGNGPLTVPGERISVTGRGVIATRHVGSQAIGNARTWASRPGTAFTDSPPSLQHIARYYKAAPWVPDAYERTLLVRLGRAYGYCVGIPMAALFYGIAWVFARPLRFSAASFIAMIVGLAAWVS